MFIQKSNLWWITANWKWVARDSKRFFSWRIINRQFVAMFEFKAFRHLVVISTPRLNILFSNDTNASSFSNYLYCYHQHMSPPSRGACFALVVNIIYEMLTTPNWHSWHNCTIWFMYAITTLFSFVHDFDKGLSSSCMYMYIFR